MHSLISLVLVDDIAPAPLRLREQSSGAVNQILVDAVSSFSSFLFSACFLVFGKINSNASMIHGVTVHQSELPYPL